jgi:hypothetical protein
MADRPNTFQGARITRHVLQKMVERGFANTEHDAEIRILDVLDWPGLVTEAQTEGREQWRLQEASDGNKLVVIVDVDHWSVPTAYVSGHTKPEEA